MNANATVDSTAQYSIDNGTLFPFQVFAQNKTVQIHDLGSFQTPTLSPGPHRLFVQYSQDNLSSGTIAPLVLDYLIIQNLTIPPFNTTSSPHARLSKGAIAGIVIGSLVGALIVIILIWVVWKPKSAAAQVAQRSEGDGKGQ